MNFENRFKLIQRVAFAVRYAVQETGLNELPPDSYFIVPYGDESSELKKLLGYEVLITDSLGGDEIKLAIKSKYRDEAKLLKYFNEGLTLYDYE